MPYVHFYEFGVRPETMDLWVPHAHNNLSVMARKEGLLSMRLFRDRQEPTHFFSIRVWRTKEDAQRALASPEVQLAIRTNIDHGMSEGYPTIEREFTLLDHVFGRKGVKNFLRLDGGFTQVVFFILGGSSNGDASTWKCSSFARRSTSVFAVKPEPTLPAP